MVGIKGVWIPEAKCPDFGLTRDDFAGAGVDNALFENNKLWGFVLIVINFDEMLRSSLIGSVDDDSEYVQIMFKLNQYGQRRLVWRNYHADDPNDEMIREEEYEVNVIANKSKTTQWMLGTMYRGGWGAATKSQFWQNVTDMQIVICVVNLLVGAPPAQPQSKGGREGVGVGGGVGVGAWNQGVGDGMGVFGCEDVVASALEHVVLT